MIWEKIKAKLRENKTRLEKINKFWNNSKNPKAVLFS